MVKQHQATTKLIGELVKHKFTDMARTNIRPHNIINEMRKKYGVNMSYKKAWRSKDEETYALLPSFAYMLESSNPGSLVALETIEDDQFFCFFMCLATFI